jgi:hypothetical protein
MSQRASDPDGLNEQQRVLVNAAHRAIVSSSRTAATARTSPDKDRAVQPGDQLTRAQAAVRAALAARVPQAVLERTMRSASAIGREEAL